MRRWRLWISLLVSALFLALALRGLELEKVAESLRSARYAWLIPALLAYFVTVAARSWRWAYLLRPLQAVSGGELFPVMAIGYLGNNIYPLRIGELLRAYLLRRREGVAISAGLATILVERIFDGLALLTLVMLSLPLLPLPASDFRPLLILGTVVFISALLFLLLLAARPHWALRFLTALTFFLPARLGRRLEGVAQRFLEGLGALSDPRRLLLVLISSLAIWLLEAGKLWLVMQAFPFSLSVPSVIFLDGVVSLATTLPSAPGYVGTFDAPAIAVLVLLGVPQTVASAYTLTLHASLWLPSVIVGFFFMVREGLSWSDLGQAAQVGQEGAWQGKE